jgi:hypothetical protein
VALRKRRKVEALFSELKNLIGLRRLRLRRINFVREQFYLAAVAQNLKRLVRFLNMRATSDGNRVRNRLPQEKHEPEETPLRENASSNRVFQHQLAISLKIPLQNRGGANRRRKLVLRLDLYKGTTSVSLVLANYHRSITTSSLPSCAAFFRTPWSRSVWSA